MPRQQRLRHVRPETMYQSEGRVELIDGLINSSEQEEEVAAVAF